jgi:hypothetical protein
MLTAARPLSDPRILSILGERAQQDDSKMICLLPRHSRLFAQPLVGEVRGAAAAGRFILRASAFQAKDIRPPYFSESLILESVRPGDLAAKPKSEASSLSSPGVRALRDEPTEAIPQTSGRRPKESSPVRGPSRRGGCQQAVVSMSGEPTLILRVSSPYGVAHPVTVIHRPAGVRFERGENTAQPQTEEESRKSRHRTTREWQIQGKRETHSELRGMRSRRAQPNAPSCGPEG